MYQRDIVHPMHSFTVGKFDRLMGWWADDVIGHLITSLLNKPLEFANERFRLIDFIMRFDAKSNTHQLRIKNILQITGVHTNLSKQFRAMTRKSLARAFKWFAIINNTNNYYSFRVFACVSPRTAYYCLDIF